MELLALLEAVLQRLPYPVTVTDRAGHVVLANPAALTLLGWTPEASGSLATVRMADAEGRPVDLCALAAAGTGAGGVEVVLTRADGSTSNVLVETVPMAEDASAEARVVVALLDVSAQRLYEETLHHAAYYDSLTGLPNRGLLWQHLGAAVRSARPYGILLVDLNDFKAVNDTRGHQIGDELLRCVAQRLGKAAGERTLVARLGGDEFAILVPDTTVGEVMRVAEALRAIFDTPFLLSCGAVDGRATVGLAVGKPGQAADAVIAAADSAMYGAKPRTGSRVPPRDATI